MSRYPRDYGYGTHHAHLDLRTLLVCSGVAAAVAVFMIALTMVGGVR